MFSTIYNTITRSSSNSAQNTTPGIPNITELISIIEEQQPRVTFVVTQASQRENPLVKVFSGDISMVESHLNSVLVDIDNAQSLDKIYSGLYPTTYKSGTTVYVASSPGQHIPVLTWRLGSLYLIKGLKSWSSDDFSCAVDYFEWHSTTGEKEGFPGAGFDTPVFINSRAGKAMAYLSLSLMQLCRVQGKYKIDMANKDIVYHTYYYMVYAEKAAKMVNSPELDRIMLHSRAWHSIYTGVDFFLLGEKNETAALAHIASVIASNPEDIVLMRTLYASLSQISSASPGLLGGIKQMWTSPISPIPIKTYSNPPQRAIFKTIINNNKK